MKSKERFMEEKTIGNWGNMYSDMENDLENSEDLDEDDGLEDGDEEDFADELDDDELDDNEEEGDDDKTVCRFRGSKTAQTQASKKSNLRYAPKETTSGEYSKVNKGVSYDAKIEMLIDMALADGMLTKKEEQVLLRKAKALGIDLDEFEIVLEAKLAQTRRIEENALKPSRTNKREDVRKCPACGELLDGVTVKCPACGYRFVETNSIAKEQDTWTAKLKQTIINLFD